VTLHLYFARKFATALLGVFVIFFLFLTLLDLVDQIRRFDFGAITFGQALGLSLLNSPAALYTVLPLIVTLAALTLYLSLARTSELVVSRASGRSALRSLGAPVITALMMGLLTIAVFNPLVAATSKYYEQRMADYKDSSTSVVSIGRDGLWLRQGSADGQMVIRADETNLDGTVLYDVTFIEFSTTRGPVMRIDAEMAELLNGAWQLEVAKQWQLGSDQPNPELNATVSETLALPTDLTRDRIRDSFGAPSSIPIWELPAFIDAMQRAGFSPLRHQVWLQMELALPLFFVAMVMVVAGFTMRHTRFGRTGLMVLLALSFALSLYFLRSFAQVLGENGQIPVILAAWTPPVVGILLALGLLLHLEDG